MERHLYTRETKARPLFLLLGQHAKHTSQLNKMSFEVRLAYSFLAEARLAIPDNTIDVRFAVAVASSLKILSFLSFQIDHNIAKGAILHRIRPHPERGTHLQDSANSAKEEGVHHAIPHHRNRWFHMEEATSQWMK